MICEVRLAAASLEARDTVGTSHTDITRSSRGNSRCKSSKPGQPFWLDYFKGRCTTYVALVHLCESPGPGTVGADD